MATVTISIRDEFEQRLRDAFNKSGYKNFSGFVEERLRDGLATWEKVELH